MRHSVPSHTEEVPPACILDVEPQAHPSLITPDRNLQIGCLLTVVGRGCGVQDPDYEPYRRYLLGTLTQEGVSTQDSLPAPTEPSPTDSQQVLPAWRRRTLASAALWYARAKEMAGNCSAEKASTAHTVFEQLVA